MLKMKKLTRISMCLCSILMLTNLSYAATITPTTADIHLLVVNKLAKKISFFDGLSYQKQTEISTPPRPHEVLISPDHQNAYVSIYGDGIYGNNPHPGHSLLQIDLKTMKTVGLIELPGCKAPHGMANEPQSGLIWITCDISGNITILNPKTQKVVGNIPLGTTGNHWLTILPDGSKAYIPDRAKPLLHVVDVAQRKVISTIPLAHPATGIATSPDGKKVYVIDEPTPSFYVIDTQQDKVLKNITIKGFPFVNKIVDREMRIAVSPNNKYIVIANFASGVIAIIDTKHLQQQKLIAVDRGPMGVAFPPRHPSQVLIAEHETGTMVLIDMVTGQEIADFDAGGIGPETLSFY